MASPRRRHLGSRSNASCRSRTSSLGVSAALAAACCSTLVLQALTTALEPHTALSSSAPTTTSVTAGTAGVFAALLAHVGSSAAAAASSSFSFASLGGSSSSTSTVDVRTMDLRVANVSVHRVRYVNREHTRQTSDDAPVDSSDDRDSGWNGSRSESFVDRWTRRVRALRERQLPAHVTSVVVTWDDHFRAASALTSSAGDADDTDMNETEENATSDALHTVRSGVEVTYEVQHWVTGWGLDALWHASNRVVAVADPFVVLSSLPQEHELAFRVRMRVKHTASRLSWFATETEGPWSAPTVLSPSRDDALDAIFAFLLSDKAFFVVLLVCVGAGSLVVGKLFVSHRWTRTHTSSTCSRTSCALATTPPPSDALDESTSDSRSDAPLRPLEKRSGRGDVVQELQDLRQELADSEAEVRQLMVFRGYGVERLAAPELAAVERELRATLQRIQTLRQPHAAAGATKASGCDRSSEDDVEGDDEMSDDETHRRPVDSRGDFGRGCGRRRTGVSRRPSAVK